VSDSFAGFAFWEVNESVGSENAEAKLVDVDELAAGGRGDSAEVGDVGTPDFGGAFLTVWSWRALARAFSWVRMKAARCLMKYGLHKFY